MDHQANIQRALDLIEANLKHDFHPADLARAIGYSPFHFLRLFKKTVGLTPADYIRKRRLSEIVRCMMRESRPISDIAFEYGFNSKENFIRAFKREHRILPTEFRDAQNSLRLYDRVILSAVPPRIEADITELEEFCLVAYPSDEASPPQFWNKYNAGGLSGRLSGGRVVEDFGVSEWDATTQTLRYYIGIRENEACGDRTGTVTLTISRGTYAVFETTPTTQFDFVSTIRLTWDQIGVWLLENGYRRTGGYELESYIEESRLFSERIYIPVIKEEKRDHEKTECDL